MKQRFMSWFASDTHGAVCAGSVAARGQTVAERPAILFRNSLVLTLVLGILLISILR